jgi:hypothetical protein
MHVNDPFVFMHVCPGSHGLTVTLHSSTSVNGKYITYIHISHLRQFQNRGKLHKNKYVIMFRYVKLSFSAVVHMFIIQLYRRKCSSG